MYVYVYMYMCVFVKIYALINNASAIDNNDMLTDTTIDVSCLLCCMLWIIIMFNKT